MFQSTRARERATAGRCVPMTAPDVSIRARPRARDTSRHPNPSARGSFNPRRPERATGVHVEPHRKNMFQTTRAPSARLAILSRLRDRWPFQSTRLPASARPRGVPRLRSQSVSSTRASERATRPADPCMAAVSVSIHPRPRARDSRCLLLVVRQAMAVATKSTLPLGEAQSTRTASATPAATVRD